MLHTHNRTTTANAAAEHHNKTGCIQHDCLQALLTKAASGLQLARACSERARKMQVAPLTQDAVALAAGVRKRCALAVMARDTHLRTIEDSCWLQAAAREKSGNKQASGMLLQLT